jgi:hypothetical protein
MSLLSAVADRAVASTTVIPVAAARAVFVLRPTYFCKRVHTQLLLAQEEPELPLTRRGWGGPHLSLELPVLQAVAAVVAGREPATLEIPVLLAAAAVLATLAASALIHRSVTLEVHLALHPVLVEAAQVRLERRAALVGHYSRVLEVLALLTLLKLVLLSITVAAVAAVARLAALRLPLVALAVVAVANTRAMLLRLPEPQTQEAEAVGATMVEMLLAQMAAQAS